jgi:hypothetical protein
MFECRACKAKNDQIDILNKMVDRLEKNNADLLDRIMAFTKDAFVSYQAEKKVDAPLFPVAVDDKGNQYSYSEVKLEDVESDMVRAFNEDPISVEDRPEEVVR